MSILNKVDKHIIVVMNWFNDPSSVSKDELTSNKESAKSAYSYAVAASYADATYTAADAAYAAYTTADAADAIYSTTDATTDVSYANKCMDDYFKLVNIDRKEVEAELFGSKGAVNELVQNPKHYELFEDTSVIEVIAGSMSAEAFHGYCLGNILKYRLRNGKKDDTAQELSKADKYNELYAEYKHLCR